MKKNSISIITLVLLAGCFMFSCSKETSNEEQLIKGTKIVIPAEKVGTKAVDVAGKATFQTSESVYVYANSAIDSGELHPTEDAASTTFTGTLMGSYDSGDHISVLYNTNASGVVDYSNQDGAIENVKDGGWAADVEIVSLEGDVLTTESAKLQNLQSIFRFTFINESTSAEISGVRFVRIYSDSNKLVAAYDVLTPANSTYGQVVVSRNTNLADNYIYVALRFDANPSDEIHFEVIDNAGTIYQGSKTAPTEGFANGKFYTSTVTVTPVAPGVPYSNIATLKYAINAPLATLSELKSTYECKYIDKDGNISDTKGANDAGIIAYLNSSNITWGGSQSPDHANKMTSQNSISFSGMRILVLAMETNDSHKATWNYLNENGVTSSVYNAPRPVGSTVWFVPSLDQLVLTGFSSSGAAPSKAAAVAIIPSGYNFIWSSSINSSSGTGRAYRIDTKSFKNETKTNSRYVLPCFAY